MPSEDVGAERLSWTAGVREGKRAICHSLILLSRHLPMSKQFHLGMYPKEMILWVCKGTCKGFGSTLSVYPCECG